MKGTGPCETADAESLFSAFSMGFHVPAPGQRTVGDSSRVEWQQVQGFLSMAEVALRAKSEVRTLHCDADISARKFVTSKLSRKTSSSCERCPPFTVLPANLWD